MGALLNVDTIRYDFDTMDFLSDRTEENPNKKYTGILTGSGYKICEFDKEEKNKTVEKDM
jgi:hypothetical protein